MTPRGEDRPGPRGPGRRYLHRRGQGQRTNCITAGRVGTGRRGVEEDPRMGGLPVGVPGRTRDLSPSPGRVLPRYNPSRPPGRGSVWQSTWFGIRGSQVQILPPRRGVGGDRRSPCRCLRKAGGMLQARMVVAGSRAAMPVWKPPPGKPAPAGKPGHSLRRSFPAALFAVDNPPPLVLNLRRTYALRLPAMLSFRIGRRASAVSILPTEVALPILAARMAEAGSQRAALSYWR